jgi:hypothetical protein
VNRPINTKDKVVGLNKENTGRNVQKDKIYCYDTDMLSFSPAAVGTP